MGVFRINGNSKTIKILREHFTTQLRRESGIEAMVCAANLPENIPYGVYEVADAFKSFIRDLPGGILGDVELFNSLSKNLPNQQLANSDLSLDFGCFGPQDPVNPKWIAQILRGVSDKERLSLILLVFGIMASVRVTYYSPRASKLAANPPCDDSTGPYTQHSGDSSNISSGQPILRTMKSTSHIKLPCVLTDPNTPLPIPARSAIRTMKSPGNLGDLNVNICPAIPFNAPKVPMGEYSRHRPFITHPEYSNVHIFDSPDTASGHTSALVEMDLQSRNIEPTNNAQESSNHAHKYGDTISTMVSSIPGSLPHSPGSPVPPRENFMTPVALGKIFAPLLLGNKLDTIELLTPNHSSIVSTASYSTDDSRSCYSRTSSDHPLPPHRGKGKAKADTVPNPMVSAATHDAAGKAGGKAKGKNLSLMCWLRGKKEGDGKAFDESQQRLKLAAWVVECLVENWEDIVAEYVKGPEGVDAQVECMAAYYSSKRNMVSLEMKEIHMDDGMRYVAAQCDDS